MGYSGEDGVKEFPSVALQSGCLHHQSQSVEQLFPDMWGQSREFGGRAVGGGRESEWRVEGRAKARDSGRENGEEEGRG